MTEVKGNLNGAELYDPKNERWSVTGSLNTPRFGHTATLLKNGKVLVAGGGEIIDRDEIRPLDTVISYGGVRPEFVDICQRPHF